MGGFLIIFFLLFFSNLLLDSWDSPRLSSYRRTKCFFLCVKKIVSGNPTGQCLSRQNIEELIKLCSRNSLLILADEVYQTNIYDPKRPFYSFKKILRFL